MKVEIGSRVKSRDGQDVGAVKHLIVDPSDNRVHAVVLEQGFILTRDSVVGIEDLSLNAENEVQLNRLADEVKDLPAFHASDFRAPDVDDDLRDDGEPRRYGEPVAGMLWPAVNPYPGSITGQGGYGAFPIFAPVGDVQQHVPAASVDRSEVNVPDDEVAGRSAPDPASHLTTIGKGSDVYAMNGEKVGSVNDVEFDAVSGRPLSLTISRGTLFTETVTLPADKIATVEDGAVYLSMDDEEFSSWTTAPSVPYV